MKDSFHILILGDQNEESKKWSEEWTWVSRNFLVVFLNQIQSDLVTTFLAGGMYRGEGPNF